MPQADCFSENLSISQQPTEKGNKTRIPRTTEISAGQVVQLLYIDALDRFDGLACLETQLTHRRCGSAFFRLRLRSITSPTQTSVPLPAPLRFNLRTTLPTKEEMDCQ